MVKKPHPHIDMYIIILVLFSLRYICPLHIYMAYWPTGPLTSSEESYHTESIIYLSVSHIPVYE